MREIAARYGNLGVLVEPAEDWRRFGRRDASRPHSRDGRAPGRRLARRTAERSCFRDDSADVVEEPAIDLRELKNFFDRHPVLKCLGEMENALGIGDRELEAERFGIEPLVIAVAAKTEAFDLKGTQRYLDR